MKKYYLITASVFFVNLCFSQSPEIKTQLPTITPPSPTVAALMRFEETPVSNYTGIPDISIPLFSSPTLSKDINLDLSLKYHPSGAAAEEKASDVGLGWSLFAGGTISRTVRSMPDEIFTGATAANNGKVGIYQTPENGKTNTYYYIINRYENPAAWNTSDTEILNEYLYEAHEKGKYDTEQDLWQFNFMGRTGRFFIKKNLSTGLLEVEPLDDYNLKIVNLYGATGNAFEPTGFIVYDDKGYKYYFDIAEVTETNSAVDNLYPHSYGTTSFADKITFKSAFHLSQIRDNNEQILITLGYDSRITKEMTVSGSEKSATPVPLTAHETIINHTQENAVPGTCTRFLEPSHSGTASFKRVYTKKLLSIDVTGIAKIAFDFVKGDREDTQMVRIDSTYRLKAIVIRDWNSNPVKKIELTHSYPQLLFNSQVKKRMVLDNVKMFDKDFSQHLDYVFSYYNQPDNVNLTSDLWGYFTPVNCEKPIAKEPDGKYCTQDLLRKIQYPTGGCTTFDFEANQYSYIGEYPAEDYEQANNFDRNKANSYVDNTIHYSFDRSAATPSIPYAVTLSSVAANQWVDISSTVTESDQLNGSKFLVLKKNGTVYNGLVFADSCPDGKKRILLEPANTYTIEYTLGNPSLNADVEQATVEYIKMVNGSSYKKYFIGGGNRVKRIRYFKTDVAENYDDGLEQYVTTETPERQKSYDYNFFNEPRRSSGSLAYHKPVYLYYFSNMPCIECSNVDSNVMYTYQITTSYNNLPQRKTQGADVGYQNVTVYETGNGKTEYIYTSPIDISSLDVNAPAYPFDDSTPDIDYLRGQNTSEKIYNDAGKLLKETISTFVTEEFTKTTSLNLRYFTLRSNCHGISLSKTYAMYKSFREEYAPAHLYWCDCGIPSDYMVYYRKSETYGWAKLNSKTTKDYFYPTGSSPATIVQSNETFTYNPINRQISENTVTNSKGEVLKTKYFYHTGNATGHQNRISEIEKIESYRGTDLLTTSKIDYLNTFPGNASYLPAYVKTSKGAGALESRIRFNKYDEYGHPLEVQQENGMLTCYIWGYNKSQPVAKIDNLAYASIPGATITDIQTKTDTANNEANVLTALNALRTSFPAAMVTTYTYIPQVGVSTITDPKGDKITYKYDEFQRLKEVRDKDNNILSENQYNYRPQN